MGAHTCPPAPGGAHVCCGRGLRPPRAFFFCWPPPASFLLPTLRARFARADPGGPPARFPPMRPTGPGGRVVRPFPPLVRPPPHPTWSRGGRGGLGYRRAALARRVTAAPPACGSPLAPPRTLRFFPHATPQLRPHRAGPRRFVWAAAAAFGAPSATTRGAASRSVVGVLLVSWTVRLPPHGLRKTSAVPPQFTEIMRGRGNPPLPMNA